MRPEGGIKRIADFIGARRLLMLQHADRFALLQPSPKDGLVEIQTQAVPSQPDGFGEMLRRKRIGKMAQERPSRDDTRRGHRGGHKVFELAAAGKAKTSADVMVSSARSLGLGQLRGSAYSFRAFSVSLTRDASRRMFASRQAI